MEESPSTDVRFNRIYGEHLAAVQSYCLRRLPVADANDAVSDVFFVAWRKIESVPMGEETLPWLYGVARDAVRNSGRSTRRHDGLRPNDREVLRLRAWEGLSASQIAGVLDLSLDAAEKRLARAMKRLETAVGNTSEKSSLVTRPHVIERGGDA